MIGKFFQKILVSVLALAMALVPSSSVMALTIQQLNEFAQNDILFYDPNGGPGGGCYSGNLSGDTIMAKVVSYLKGNNPTGFVLSNNGVAGVLANFQGESGFNPFRFQSDSLSGPAYGIAQFDPMSKITDKLKADSRTANYFNEYFDLKYTYYNEETGLPTESVPMAVVDAWLSVQLDFFFGSGSEFENTKVGDYRNYGGTMGLDYIDGSMTAHEALDAARTPEDATRIFVWIMERPGDKEGAANGRSQNAQKWLQYTESMSSGGSSGGGSTSSKSDGNNVTIIGDSITAESEAEIKALLPNADIRAQRGKQFYIGTADNPGGLTILEELAGSNSLRDVVVYALGTDGGGVTEAQIKEVVNKVGNSKKIIFVTNYTTADDFIGNNNNFSKAKNEYSNVFIADWKGAIESQPTDYLASNGIYPNAEGQKLFASIIASTVNGADNANSVCIVGSVDGGLTDEQAQRLADYYNSDEIDPYDWGFYEGTKNNCVAFSQFFVQRFTDKGKGWGTWGNGKDVASDVAALASLPEGTDARPFALFSVTQGRATCEGGYKCGHTGIVVAVNGDEITTVEAAWGTEGGAYVGHYDISYFINTQYGNTFTYLDSILNQSDLAQIVGN